MTDRELLELAAKAAGWGDFDWLANDGYMNVYDDAGRQESWNPLTDDGDALRLAVKLWMHLQVDADGCCVLVGKDIELFEANNDDPYSATRRAIVRAAAEIGRSM